MERILIWLSGKKTTIMAIIALFVTLALTKQWIDNDWAIFINGVLVVLGFGANYATNRIYNQYSDDE